jgi:hypothetical protein
LTLDLTPGPRWIDLPLPGNRTLSLLMDRPATPLVIRARAAARALTVPEGLDDRTERDLRTHAFGVALAHLCLRDWRGVAIGPDDTPAPVTPEAVAALLAIDAVWTEFFDRWLGPVVLLAETEKNVFTGAPAGIGAGAPDIAETAPPPA